MSTVTFRLEEQLSDLRSNYVAYRFVVENQGASPIQLVNVEPRTPEGVKLVEVKDTSLVAANAKRAQLLGDLTKLLHQHLFVTSSPFRDEWLKHSKEMREKYASENLALRLVLKRSQREWAERVRREFQGLRFRIDSSVDAEYALERWMKSDDPLTEPIKSIFEAKAKQLSRIETQMSEAERKGLSTIEPGSFFAITYIFRFPRSLIEPRKYQVAVEAAYSEVGAESTHVGGASVGVLVSPHPWLLSVIAVVGSLLGVIVQVAVSSGGEDSSQGTQGGGLLDKLSSALHEGGFVVAPIVALIFFNIYEHTAIGQAIRMPVSWRAALLIGTLCGLAQDRILAAIQAFLG